MRNPGRAQSLERIGGAGQRPRGRDELAKNLGVPTVDRLGLLRGQLPPGIALGVADDKFPARPDVAVQAEAVHGNSSLGESLLPGEYMRVDGVDQRPVQIEEQRAWGTHADASRARTAIERDCTSYPIPGTTTFPPASAMSNRI